MKHRRHKIEFVTITSSSYRAGHCVKGVRPLPYLSNQPENQRFKYKTTSALVGGATNLKWTMQDMKEY